MKIQKNWGKPGLGKGGGGNPLFIDPNGERGKRQNRKKNNNEKLEEKKKKKRKKRETEGCGVKEDKRKIGQGWTEGQELKRDGGGDVGRGTLKEKLTKGGRPEGKGRERGQGKVVVRV